MVSGYCCLNQTAHVGQIDDTFMLKWIGSRKNKIRMSVPRLKMRWHFSISINHCIESWNCRVITVKQSGRQLSAISKTVNMLSPMERISKDREEFPWQHVTNLPNFKLEFGQNDCELGYSFCFSGVKLSLMKNFPVFQIRSNLSTGKHVEAYFLDKWS